MVLDRRLGDRLFARDVDHFDLIGPRADPAKALGRAKHAGIMAIGPDHRLGAAFIRHTIKFGGIVNVRIIASTHQHIVIEVNFIAAEAHRASLAFGEARRHNDRAARKVFSQRAIDLIFVNVARMDHEDDVIGAWQVFHGSNDHGNSVDGNQRLGRGVTGVCKTLSEAGHGNDELHSSELWIEGRGRSGGLSHSRWLLSHEV